jgi:hypothetical protein
MFVRLLEKTRTTVGTLEPGIVDLPVADVMRLVREGLVEIMDEDPTPDPMPRRNAMIKNYVTR